MLLAEVADDPGVERVEVVDRLEPRQSTVQIVTVKPNEWKNGRMPSTDLVADELRPAA